MSFTAFGLEVKKLPEPYAEFIVWCCDASLTAQQLQKILLESISSSVYFQGPWRHLELSLQQYMRNSQPQLQLLGGRRVPGPAVAGRVITGETSTAEWALVDVLLRVSKQHPNIIAQIHDGDGCFLAIEAADHLPLWCTPETADNRVFIAQGAVHFLPPPKSASSPPSAPSLEEATVRLTDQNETTVAAAPVQRAIQDRILATISDPLWSWSQRLSVRTTRCAASILRKLPWAASAAIEAIASELVTPKTLQHSVLLPLKSTPPHASDGLVLSSVTVSRLAAAKLANASVLPNKAMHDDVYAQLVEAISVTSDDAVPDVHSAAWQLRFGVALSRGLDALLLHSPEGPNADDVDTVGPLCMRGALLSHQGELQAALTEAQAQEATAADESDLPQADSMEWLRVLQHTAGGGEAVGADAGVGESLPQFLSFLSSAHDVRGVAAGGGAGESRPAAPDQRVQLGGHMAAYADDDAASVSSSDSSASHGEHQQHEGGVRDDVGGGSTKVTSSATHPSNKDGFAELGRRAAATRAQVEEGGWMDSGSDDDDEDVEGKGGGASWQREVLGAAGDLMDEELGQSTLRHSFVPREEGGEPAKASAAVQGERRGGEDEQQLGETAVPIPSEEVMANNYVSSLTASVQSGHGAGPAAVTLAHLQ